MTPIATGSDTGGSLRIPAALCGVVGMRPTPGLVPRGGRTPGWTPISVYGPIARDVSEAALMLSVIAGDDPRDPLSGPVDSGAFATPPHVDPGTLRVAWSEDLGFSPVEPVQREALHRAVDGLGSHFAAVEQADPPLHDADWIFEVIRASQFLAGHLQHYREQRDLLGPNLIENLEQAMTFSFEDMAMATAAHGALYRRFLEFGDRRDPGAHVLPLAGAGLRHHPHHTPGHQHPLWPRCQRPALRPTAGGTAWPGPAPAGHRRGTRGADRQRHGAAPCRAGPGGPGGGRPGLSRRGPIGLRSGRDRAPAQPG